jgi:hypothetical protein
MFFDRFKGESYYPKILDFLYDYFEKSKDYDLSIWILWYLIRTEVFTNKREKWMHRLALDLKHKKEMIMSYWICHKAITEGSKFSISGDALYSHSRNSILTTMNNVKRPIWKIFAEYSKKHKVIIKKSTLKDFKKRISKEKCEEELSKLSVGLWSEINFLITYFQNSESWDILYIQIIDPKTQIDKISHLFSQNSKEDESLLDSPLESFYNNTYFSNLYLDWRKMTSLGDSSTSWKYKNNSTNEIFSVEDLALHYYTQTLNFSGIHSENSLGTTLFCLLLFSQIYLPIPNSFLSPFQSIPLDFPSKEFFYRREQAILDRLQEVERMSREEIEKEVDKLWERNRGKRGWVDWDSVKFSKQKMVDVVGWLGGK